MRENWSVEAAVVSPRLCAAIALSVVFVASQGLGRANAQGVATHIPATPFVSPASGGPLAALTAAPRAVLAASAAVPTPPTVSCSANPSIINQGATATITAAGSSPQDLPLTYSYSTSAGSISGTDTKATLATSGLSAGLITVTCTVDQQGGGTASSTTHVLVQSVTGTQALTNFQFTDSVGVNVHLSYIGTVYSTNFPQILQSMSSHWGSSTIAMD